ncbi:MAG: hypothetical protein H0T76_28700 [Nannocystis sp.]|nr:hypothetical protein [Nannocystis sp.]MBA3550474.1 hypothetical protein [Nannocystis sp.]
MTLFIRTILLSLSALLTAGTLTACDTDELEALGVDLEDIDAMSEEELDELAHGEAHIFDLAAPPTEPLPPLPRPPVPGRKLAVAPTHADADVAPFFAHTADLLASDKLGLPDDEDEGCDTNGDERDLVNR